MRKHMIENAAFEVATQIRTVEDSIDSVLGEIAELQSRLIRARSISGVGVATGHEALEKLVGANQAVVGARSAIAGCHAALVEAKSQIPGLRAVAIGDGGECPPPTGFADLRVVA
jgi:hypothetical protein